MNKTSLKYFLVSIFCLVIIFIKLSCGGKNEDADYEWVQLYNPDTIHYEGGYVTSMMTSVRKRKDETLEQCIKRMDSTYGTNLFSIMYRTK